jgi:hypothetical protein
MKQIVILDFSTGEAHIYPCSDEMEDTDLLTEKGFKEQDCQWMSVNKLKLKIHEDSTRENNRVDS